METERESLNHEPKNYSKPQCVTENSITKLSRKHCFHVDTSTDETASRDQFVIINFIKGKNLTTVQDSEEM